MTNTYYFDMDGVLVNFHKDYDPNNRSNVMKRDWIANLEPFMNNVRLMQNLIANGYKCYILTMAASEDAKQGKIDWLTKYIPSFNLDLFICIVGYGKKVDFIHEDGILIDDTAKNTNQWIKAGHKAILIERGSNIIL